MFRSQIAAMWQTIRSSEPMRLTQLTVGWILMIVGPLIGGPLPGPLGFIFFGAGLALVLRNSRWARRRYTLLKKRYPKAGGWSDWAIRRRVKSGQAKQQPDDGADAR